MPKKNNTNVNNNTITPIDELNKFFGIFSYDVLSEYEKGVYDEINSLLENKQKDNKDYKLSDYDDELRNEYTKYSKWRTYPGQYVDEIDNDQIKSNLATILENEERIKAYESQIEKTKNSLEPLEKGYEEETQKIEKLKKSYEASFNKLNEDFKKKSDEIEIYVSSEFKKAATNRVNAKTKLSDAELRQQDLFRENDWLKSEISKNVDLKNNANAKDKKQIQKAIDQANAKIDKNSIELKALDKNMNNIILEAKKADIEYEKEEKRNEELKLEKKTQIITKYNSDIINIDNMNKKVSELIRNRQINYGDQIDAHKKNISDFEYNISKTNSDNISLRNENVNIVVKEANKKLDEILDTKMKIKQYNSINNALENKIPNVTGFGVINGLAIVKKAYNDYKSKHNIVARFFKFLPFTSAHSDYNKFDNIRGKFMELTQIPKNDIDHYLDNNTYLENGQLDLYSKNMDNKMVDKILNNDIVMDKRTFKKMDGASPESYVNAVSKMYDETFHKIGTMGEWLVKSEKFLLILNELSNIKKETNTNICDEMINKISTIIPNVAYAKKDVIKMEVADALKGEYVKDKYPFTLVSPVKEEYEKAIMEDEKSYYSEGNSILLANNRDVTNIFVQDAKSDEGKVYPIKDEEKENNEKIDPVLED